MTPRFGDLRAPAATAARSTAFVMPGGATRGAVQIGMLRALREVEVVPDFLVGTSAGAMNAAVYSGDPTIEGILRLGRLWMEAPRSQIFPLSARTIARNVRGRSGFVLSNDGLRDWIETYLPYPRLEHFPIPLHVVATEVASRQAVLLSEGEALSALLASTAIPGVFPPVLLDGEPHIDGGVAANTPLPQAVSLGATTIYVLSTTPLEPPASGGPWRILDRIFGRPAMTQDFSPTPDITVHWLAAPSFEGNPFSFRSSRRLIDEAYHLTVDYLAEAPVGRRLPVERSV